MRRAAPWAVLGAFVVGVALAATVSMLQATREDPGRLADAAAGAVDRLGWSVERINVVHVPDRSSGYGCSSDLTGDLGNYDVQVTAVRSRNGERLFVGLVRTSYGSLQSLSYAVVRTRCPARTSPSVVPSQYSLPYPTVPHESEVRFSLVKWSPTMEVGALKANGLVELSAEDVHHGLLSVVIIEGHDRLGQDERSMKAVLSSF